jgi:hypothetical protein
VAKTADPKSRIDERRQQVSHHNLRSTYHLQIYPPTSANQSELLVAGNTPDEMDGASSNTSTAPSDQRPAAIATLDLV